MGGILSYPTAVRVRGERGYPPGACTIDCKAHMMITNDQQFAHANTMCKDTTPNSHPPNRQSSCLLSWIECRTFAINPQLNHPIRGRSSFLKPFALRPSES
jgi:hypothetical protein